MCWSAARLQSAGHLPKMRSLVTLAPGPLAGPAVFSRALRAELHPREGGAGLRPLPRLDVRHSARLPASGPRAYGPSSSPHICRQICKVSSSRSKRSLSGGNGTPSPWCSRSYQAAPMPSMARPPERTSSVETILARRPGVPVGHTGHEQTQTHRVGDAGEVAECGVPLEHRVLGGCHPVHLEVVVHDRELADPTLLCRPGRGQQRRTDGLRTAGNREVEVVDGKLHRRAPFALVSGRSACRGGDRNTASARPANA